MFLLPQSMNTFLVSIGNVSSLRICSVALEKGSWLLVSWSSCYISALPSVSRCWTPVSFPSHPGDKKLLKYVTPKAVGIWWHWELIPRMVCKKEFVRNLPVTAENGHLCYEILLKIVCIFKFQLFLLTSTYSFFQFHPSLSISINSFFSFFIPFSFPLLSILTYSLYFSFPLLISVYSFQFCSILSSLTISTKSFLFLLTLTIWI